MDLRERITGPPSAAERELIIREMGGSEEGFRELLEMALGEQDPLAWRATWVLDGCDEHYPGLARKHVSRIVRHLPSITSHGVLRSMLRMLCRHQVPEEQQGLLIDLCFSYLVSELYPLAVKVHAMQILYNHVLLYPELKHELLTVIEDQADHNSVAFRVRGRQIMEKLEKLD